MEIIAVVGIFAGTMSILGYLPQMVKSQKLKSMKEVSFLLLLLFTGSSLLWMIYGFYKTDLILGGLSTITFSMGLLLIIMKFVYEKKYLRYFSDQIELKGYKLSQKII
ncbi:MAG TPA: SemiSWEET family transporter [Flavobacteriaceae bacterium]|nr:SemiSWEET family transporter [Flavobacteriaceae bacterium]